MGCHVLVFQCGLYCNKVVIGTLPSGHRTLKQRRNLVEIRSLRCPKLNFDLISTSIARWVATRGHRSDMIMTLHVLSEVKHKQNLPLCIDNILVLTHLVDGIDNHYNWNAIFVGQRICTYERCLVKVFWYCFILKNSMICK